MPMRKSESRGAIESGLLWDYNEKMECKCRFALGYSSKCFDRALGGKMQTEKSSGWNESKSSTDTKSMSIKSVNGVVTNMILGGSIHLSNISNIGYWTDITDPWVDPDSTVLLSNC